MTTNGKFSMRTVCYTAKYSMRHETAYVLSGYNTRFGYPAVARALNHNLIAPAESHDRYVRYAITQKGLQFLANEITIRNAH